MAKVRTKSGRIYRRRPMSDQKKVTMVVRISRSFAPGDGITTKPMRTNSKAFVACASFKTAGYVSISRDYEPSKLHGACAYGRNPRTAIAGALRKAARNVTTRAGAFAGLHRRG